MNELLKLSKKLNKPFDEVMIIITEEYGDNIWDISTFNDAIRQFNLGNGR
jgi:hypothetical protein